jgi:hypothetical protein
MLTVFVDMCTQYTLTVGCWKGYFSNCYNLQYQPQEGYAVPRTRPGRLVTAKMAQTSFVLWHAWHRSTPPPPAGQGRSPSRCYRPNLQHQPLEGNAVPRTRPRRLVTVLLLAETAATTKTTPSQRYGNKTQLPCLIHEKLSRLRLPLPGRVFTTAQTTLVDWLFSGLVTRNSYFATRNSWLAY